MSNILEQNAKAISREWRENTGRTPTCFVAVTERNDPEHTINKLWVTDSQTKSIGLLAHPPLTRCQQVGMTDALSAGDTQKRLKSTGRSDHSRWGTTDAGVGQEARSSLGSASRHL